MCRSSRNRGRRSRTRGTRIVREIRHPGPRRSVRKAVVKILKGRLAGDGPARTWWTTSAARCSATSASSPARGWSPGWPGPRWAARRTGWHRGGEDPQLCARLQADGPAWRRDARVPAEIAHSYVVTTPPSSAADPEFFRDAFIHLRVRCRGREGRAISPGVHHGLGPAVAGPRAGRAAHRDDRGADSTADLFQIGGIQGDRRTARGDAAS